MEQQLLETQQSKQQQAQAQQALEDQLKQAREAQEQQLMEAQQLKQQQAQAQQALEDQLKAHVLMYHHRLPSPAPSLVSKAASTKSAACCRMEYGIVPVSPIGTTGSFPRMDSTGIT
jgi:hypothetical protein